MAHIQSSLDCISETIMLYLVWRNQIEKNEGPYVYVDISEWLQWFNIDQKNHSTKLIQLLGQDQMAVSLSHYVSEQLRALNAYQVSIYFTYSFLSKKG